MQSLASPLGWLGSAPEKGDLDMTNDDIINYVVGLWRGITPKYHYGNHDLLRPKVVTIATQLYRAAQEVALTTAHPSWRIYNEFMCGLTDAEAQQVKAKVDVS